MKKVILLLAVMFSINAAAQHKTTSLMLGDTIVGEVETWYTYVGDGERKDVTLFYELSSESVQAIELKYNVKVEYALEDEVIIPDTAGDLLVAAGQWKNAAYGMAAVAIGGGAAFQQGDPEAANAIRIAAGVAALFCQIKGNYLISKAGRQLNRESK